MVEHNERATLETLARIIHEVDRSPDLEAALRVVVERTRAVMRADVGSTCFTEHEKNSMWLSPRAGLRWPWLGNSGLASAKG